MKKLLFLVGLAMSAVLVFPMHQVVAAASVNYNNVISDTVFDDVNSMSASRINRFLNKFPNSCLSTNNDYSFADPTGYSHSTGYTYGSNVSAGTAIYHAAHAYGINPRVLLTTTQKEEGLVKGDGPYGCSALAFSAAMGYLCTDSGSASHDYTGVQMYVKNGVAVNSVNNTCVPPNSSGNPAYVGFSRQLINAAWLLSFDRHRAEGQNEWYATYSSNFDNSDDLGWCYTGKMANTHGKKVYRCPDETSHPDDPYISYSGQYPIDGQAITISNGATAALYTYTPHLHGQYLFNDVWVNTLGFGPTYYVIGGSIGKRYNQIGGSKSRLGSPRSNEIALATGGKYQQFQHGRIYWKSGIGAWDVGGGIGNRYLQTRADAGALGYPTSGEKTLSRAIKYQQFQGGRIYWKPGVGAKSIYGDIGSRYLKIDASESRLGWPTSNEIALSTGGKYQQFQGGRIYWKSDTGAWDVGGSIGARYLQTGADAGALGYPTSGEKTLPSGAKYQTYEGGRVYWSHELGAKSVYGSIGARYLKINADKSWLELPTSNEINLSSGGVYQQFQHGRIYWKSKTGAWGIGGSIGRRYFNIGADHSRLGYPASAEISLSTGGKYQQFQGGRIYWKHGIGAYDVGGAIGAKYWQLSGSKSKLGYPISAEVQSAGGSTVTQQYQHGSITYTYRTHKTTYKLR